MQTWDPEAYAAHARFVSNLGAPVVDLLNPLPGEHILDLGCGDGALTERLVAAGCRVVGIDSSPEQVWAALERGLDARVIDATELPFDGMFDAVFSNAVLHWIKDADRVVAGVWKALKPGGRFVAELGGHGCVNAVRTACRRALADRGIDAAACDPWHFPTADDYQARLEACGFHVDAISLFPRPTPLPSDFENWLRVFANAFLGAVATEERPGLIRDVTARCARDLLNADGVWVVDYVRLRFAARKGV